MGGGLFNTGGVFTVDGSTFTTETATSGAGNVGGSGGTGSTFGKGGNGSNAGIGAGGAIFNQGGDLTVGANAVCSFTSNTVTVLKGGDGGASSGSGGNANSGPTGVGGIDDGGLGFGGAIASVNSNLSVSSSTFGGSGVGTGNQVIGDGAEPVASSAAKGGTGTTVYGGAIAVNNTTKTLVNNALDLTLKGDIFTANSITAGAGGDGGFGGGKGGQGGAGWAAPCRMTSGAAAPTLLRI